MSIPPRYRCSACGNLTRFDVTVTRRTQEFHHFSVGGALTVEEAEVLAEDIEAVSCRWCGSTTSVEAVPTRTQDEPGPSEPVQG